MTETELIEIRKLWTPDLSIEQALMLAEKIGGLELNHNQDNGWWASLGRGYSHADTPALAICLAIRAWMKTKVGDEDAMRREVGT